VKALLFALAKKAKAKSVAVLFEDSNPGRNTFNTEVKPTLAEFGVTDVVGVPIFPAATAPAVQQAILNAGADKVDGIAILSADAVCIGIADAIRNLGLDIAVAAYPTCSARSVATHLAEVGESGPVPDGWYIGSAVNNPYLPAKGMGTDIFLNKATKYGGSDIDLGGPFAAPAFTTVLTAVKFLNEVGPDKATPDTLAQTVQAFTGPMMMTPGKIECPGSDPYPPLCGTAVELTQFKNGKWRSIRSSSTDNPFQVEDT
jgi:branched-chain amino acid transport system substrate-binding protein